jgi:hypothetical protein
MEVWPKSAGKASAPADGDQEQRLREIERKLEQILRMLERQPAGGGGPRNDAPRQ